MKCPECVEAGERSKVWIGDSTTTFMNCTPGYFDEDGEWVEGEEHNTTTTYYKCSNDHYWRVDS